MSDTTLAPIPAVNGTPKQPDRLVSYDTGPSAHLYDTARFEQSQRVAMAMARASLLPKHLRGSDIHESQANCLRIVNQAVRWGMDPFAIMDETYVVGGKLGYSGKLVAAVVNANAGLVGRLDYTFTGTPGKDDFTVTVSGQFAGGTAPKIVTLSVGQAKTENKMWKADPEQKLCYSGAVKWARRWCPEVVLGVVTDDDLEHVTPPPPANAATAALRERMEGAGKPKTEALSPKPTEDEAGPLPEGMADWSGAPERGESR